MHNIYAFVSVNFWHWYNIELKFLAWAKQNLEKKKKLIQYRFERSIEKLQINLVVYSCEKIKITPCFSSENYEFVSQERELTEDLLEEDLLPDSWYLVPQYELIEVEASYFKRNNITNFVLIR